MTPDKWNGCTSIRLMLDHLRREGCWQVLWTFLVLCTVRIRDQLPSELAVEVLDEIRGCRNAELSARLVELESALKQEEKHHHARMVFGRHESRQHAVRATNDYLSIEVLLLVYEHSRDLAGGGEAVISETVADVAANRDLIRVGRCDLGAEHFLREHDLFRREELRKQIDLLRTIQPILPSSGHADTPVQPGESQDADGEADS